MSERANSHPCVARPSCGGLAVLTLDPAHKVPDDVEESGGPQSGDFLGDRLIYRCNSCSAEWYEDGSPLANMKWAESESDDD